MLQSVAARGWWHIDCDAVAYDWKDELREHPQRVADNAIHDMEQRRATGADSAIVLFHSWPDPAPEAIRIVVDHARARGDALVPLTDVPRRAWNRPLVL